jgi:uncharacterized circularly permuted ATP-grasp superfamily protein
MSANQVAAASAWLDERIARAPGLNAELFAQLTERQRELGLLHDDRPICPFLRPLLLSRGQYARIAQAAQTLAGAFGRLAEAALEDDEILQRLGLTAAETALARIEPGYAPLCATSRLDAYLNGDEFQFLEYNAESPAGLADQGQLEKLLFDLPHIREFLARHATWRPAPHEQLLQSLLETYRAWGGAAEKPHIAIVDWRGVATESEFFVLQEHFERAGYPTRIADPHDLTFDGAHLYAGDFRVDIFYKRVIIHEFLEKFDATHPLARAYAAGKVCMANSFRAKAAHKKAGFDLLSNPRFARLFTHEQRASISRHIPWTRVVRDERTVFFGEENDLLAILRRERERLVLKPNDDYGGYGITIGWETDESAWDAAIEHALQRDYVAQVRVAVEKQSVPMYDDAGRIVAEPMFIDFNPFLFRHEVAGGMVRLSASSLCNVSSGGGVTALLVLES